MGTEPCRIVIVEDSPTMRRFYESVLGRDAHLTLLFADDGVAGLDLAAQEPDVDLFIVDVNMPRMDGLEFIRRLRGELEVHESRVLVISTEAEPADRERATEAGADEYLPKPLRPQDLIDAVERLRTLERT